MGVAKKFSVGRDIFLKMSDDRFRIHRNNYWPIRMISEGQ